MRKIPKLRFPEFSGEWEEKRLGDLGNFYNGLSGKTKDDFVDGNSKFITYMNVFQNTISNKKMVEYVKVSKKEKQNKVKYGDILFTQSSETLEEVGMSSVWIGDADYYLNSFCFGFRFKDLYRINPIYVGFLLRSNKMRKRIILEGQGSTRYNLASSRLANVKLDLPSLPEQQKIADFLSSIDSQIETKKEQIENLEEMKKGFMQKIFSQELRFKDENGETYPEWEEKKLGEVAKITNGNSDVQDASIEYVDGYYPFFDRSNIIKYLDTYLFDNEAIIYPGEGKDFLPRYYKGKYALHQRCYAIYDADEDVDMNYLCKFLETQNSYFQRFAVGSTVPSLRMDTFVKANIRIPSLPEQQKIANFLSLFDEKIEIEKEILETLKELKKGLLQQMFV